MRRTLIFVLILLTSVISGQSYKADAKDVLNNKTLSADIATKNGNIVMICYLDSVSSKTHNNIEIYNSRRLNHFMDNIKKGSHDNIRIVKYGRDNTGTWVNTLFDLEYTGNSIIDTGYDVYTNPNAFIPVEKTVFAFMKKRVDKNGLWYGLCTREANGNSCCSFISFLKSSIVS